MSEMLTLHVAPPHAPAAGQEPLTSPPTTAIVPAETETAIVATAPTKVIVREPTEADLSALVTILPLSGTST